MTKSDEKTFQDEMIESMVANGWLLGEANKYNRTTALYEDDLLGFVQESQPKEWAKYKRFYPKDAAQRLINAVVKRLDKATLILRIKNCVVLEPWVFCVKRSMILPAVLVFVSLNLNTISTLIL